MGWLLEFCNEYVLERGLEAKGAEMLRRAVLDYSAFLGNAAALEHLDDMTVNRWLASLHGRLSPVTIANKRRHLLTLWRAAFTLGLTGKPPTRVRRLRIIDQVPRAWTIEEVQALRAAAKALPGVFRKTKIPRSDYMVAFVDFEWDTALRLGDALSVERTDIWPGNFIVIVQNKTGREHRCQISERTLESLERTGFRQRALLFPLWGDRSHFYKLFRRLRKLAGLDHGSSKWLRRSSATYVEKRHPGAAMRHLGHRTHGLAYRHYVDPRICQEDLARPPELI